MRHEILLAPEAVGDLRRLKGHMRAEVRDAIERHLRHEPTAVSKTRIKQLEGEGSPKYRLRVGDVRVFCDVEGAEVKIVAIINKAAVETWLRKAGR